LNKLSIVSLGRRRNFWLSEVTTKHDVINLVNFPVINSRLNRLINWVWDGAIAPMGEPLNSSGQITIFPLTNQRI
jgi:hypothetical protein